MASKLAEKAPGWFTRLLLPEIQEMKGGLKSINTRIDLVNTRIDSQAKEVNTRIDSLSKEVQSTNKRIDDLKDYFKDNLNMIQRLTVLEQEVRDLKKSQ